MFVWSLLACSGTPVCLDVPAGPSDAVAHVKRAREDLALADIDVCVNEVVYGETTSMQDGRLVVRADHVRADTFEAGCHVLVERDGLPDGAEALSTTGQRPGGDVDDDRASAFARACGREAERQEGAVLAALSECAPIFLDNHQRLVFDTLGTAPFLRSRETSWDEVLRLPANDLGGEPAFTDDRMAMALSSWSGEVDRFGVWSLANGQLQWTQEFDLPRYFGKVAAVGNELLVVSDFFGRVWRLEPSGAVELAPIPENALVHGDNDGWVVVTDGFRGGALFPYDPVEGAGPLLTGGVQGVLRDPAGLWVFEDEAWKRLDGTRLPLDASGLPLADLAVHDERVWSVFFSGDAYAVLSRSTAEPEPWRLERTRCTSDYGRLWTSDHGLFFARFTADYDSMVVERMLSVSATTDE